jgi:hypothetical protein
MASQCDSELLHQDRQISETAVFDDPAVNDAVEVHHRELDPVARRCDSLHLSLVRSLVCTERHHGVALSDDVLEDMVPVRECGEEGPAELSELLPVERLGATDDSSGERRADRVGLIQAAAVELLVHP